MSKKKTPTTTDRSKGIDLLSKAALLKDAQLKKVLKRRTRETHSHQSSGSDDRVGSQPKVPDELQDKTIGTNEGTGTKSRVPDVSKDLSESENESCGDDAESNDDFSDDDVSENDGNDDASDEERTESDEDENPNLNQNDDDKEKEYEEEYVHTPENYESFDDEEEYKELYKDVNVRLKDAEHGKEGKGDTEMTDASQDDVTQEKSYEQVVTSDNEIVSMMNVKVRHEEPSNQTPSLLTIHVTVTPETSTTAATTIPPHIPPFIPLPHQSTPTLTPTSIPTTTSIPALPDFSSLFGFNQRVFNLEKELLRDSVQKAFRSYTTEFKKEAEDEKKRYIDLIEKSVKDIIKDEVKTHLPQILPQAVSDFATPVIQSTMTESLENVVLAKSYSQPQSTYEAAASLTEFELKKLLIDKMEKSQSNLIADEHKELYKALVKSYKLDKDLFESYGNAFSLKRGREDKDKDEDPPAGSDQGMKRRKTSKDAESSKGSKSKESRSTSSSKGTTHSQTKSSGKPSTPDPDWNARKSVDFRPPQTWINKIVQAEKPPLFFDEIMSTPIDFSAYVMNNLKIDNLTQEQLVGPAFNLLKGTYESHVELEYNIEECYKAMTDRLDWNNPEGKEYPFDISKPLPLIMDRSRQVVPVAFFINNDLEYLREGSSSKKYTTSTTKTAKYDIPGIKDMVPSLWSPVKDMLLLLVQKKLSNLERDVIFDLGVALWMSDISNRTPYTAYNNPQGIIYEDEYKINRLMRTDELYKFSDGTLTSVKSILHDIASNMRMDYLPKRRLSSLGRKRSRIMIKAIDQQLLERRLLRSLEKFFGGRDYEEDRRLLERTI
ncbi:hypothetical protein Tco_0658716 [Tanacetum coccineum]